MPGQLWEPCPRCEQEPVCVDCGYCQRHCRCAREQADRAFIREVNRQSPGFLADVARHMEEGEQEK